MFSQELRDGVASGAITVSVRLWGRAKVKSGGQYATAGVVIEIDSVELVPFAAVTATDVRLAGESDRDSLRKRAAHSGPISDHTVVYRIEFHVVAPDQPA